MYFKRIKDLRIDADLTQQQLAEILHCNRQVYARYESGFREIPISMFITLADFYDVSMDYLAGRSDYPG